MASSIRLGFRLTSGGVQIPAANALKRIFNFNTTVLPGGAFIPQGAFSATAQFYLVSRFQASPLRIYPFTDGTNTTQYKDNGIFQIPANLAAEQYDIWVYDNGVNYASVRVNQPEIYFANSPEVSAGINHEIHGKSLVLPGFTPSVFFTPTDGSVAAMAATVDTASSNLLYLKYTTPTGLVNTKSYYVDISNGTGNGALVRLGETIKCLDGTDYFGISADIPSAANFALTASSVYKISPSAKDSRLPSGAVLSGNGSTEDTAGAQVALNYIGSNGGGILELQSNANSYIFSELSVPDKTFLKCATGASWTSPATGGAGKNCVKSTGTTYAGFINPQYVANNNTSTSAANLYGPAFINGTTHFLILGGNLGLGEGTWLNMQSNNRLYWLNSALSQGAAALASPQRGPASLNGSRRIIVKGLTINSTIDAMDFTDCTGAVMNNTHYWNGSLGNRQNTVSHFFACQGQQLTIAKNYFEGKYPDASYPKIVDPSYKKLGTNPNNGSPANNNGGSANDGECVIFERPGGDERDNISGKVTGATLTSLTDTVTPITPPVTNPVTDPSPSAPALPFTGLSLPGKVAIIAGKGRGQMRTVTSATSDTLTISQAWDVTPDTTSVYNTAPLTAYMVNVWGNTMVNPKRGILFYFCQSDKTNVMDNTNTDGGGYDFAPKQTNNRFNLSKPVTMFNTFIRNNKAKSTAGSINGVTLGFHPLSYIQPRAVGTLAFVAELISNTVENGDNTQNTVIDATFPGGLYGEMQYQSAGPDYVSNSDIPMSMGIVFDYNTTKTSKVGLALGSGMMNALVRGQTNTGNASDTVNRKISNAAKAAENVVIL